MPAPQHHRRTSQRRSSVPEAARQGRRHSLWGTYFSPPPRPDSIASPPPRTCRDSGSQARLSVSSSSEACSSWCTSNRTLPVFEHTPTRAPLKDPPEDGGLAAGAGLCSAIIAWDSNLLISCRHETHPTPSTHWLPRGGLPGTGSASRGLLPARAAQPQTRPPSAPAQPRARRRPAQRA